MVINLTFVCQLHKLSHTPLRGKEGAAFQALVRIHPECFKDGNITAWHDGFPNLEGYTEFFPFFHQTVIERGIKDDDLYAEIIEKWFAERVLR
jgi:hypothetical protein